MAVLEGRDRVRLEIGDTDTDAPLFTDDEIDTVLAERAEDVFLTAADLCDILATRFAADFDFKWKDGEFKKGSRSASYAARAVALRTRSAGGGITSVPVTRVDGYSQDLSTRSVRNVRANGVENSAFASDDFDVPV